jgi:[histone H3]-lysine4 N-trimethyltransferase ASH1L
METMAILSPTRALSSESSAEVVDTFDHVASMSSTPPTSINDSMSMTSEAPKQEVPVVSEPIDDRVAVGRVDNDATDTVAPVPSEAEEPDTNALPPAVAAPNTPVPTPSAPADDAPSTARSRRSLKNMPVYNLAKLSGTAIHGKRRANGDIVADRKRRVTVDGIIGRRNSEDAELDGQDAKEAGSGSLPNSPKARVPKKRALSPEPAETRSTRSSGPVVEHLVKKISIPGKRGKKSLEGGLTKMSREMRRLQDTNEFSGIDTKPVLYTTWSKGKYVDPNARQPRKKLKVSASKKKNAVEEEPAAVAPKEPIAKQRPIKKWLTHGLYSGQDAPLDVTKHLTPNEKKALVDLPELMPSEKVNKVLPMPMYNGLRTLIQGKDYKLPFDICNPLPAGQPKPANFKLMTKSKSEKVRCFFYSWPTLLTAI